ncbi:Trypsin [Phytophthora infestans]|uniref:Trypsin n=1 Tax=Phytophthora infestans TaxID=4787 RepID=A0A8S9UNL7_PHYIN|nr:Trypsin [Phytophthora infestans]
MFASLGSEFSSGSGSKSAEQIKVVEGYRHPLYNNDNHLYDIGLLKLETTSTQKTASLCATDGSDNRVGTMATALGWGLTEDRKSSLTLKEVDVRIISNAECNKGYRNRITEGMICAGNGNGKDSCSGDSGGPLLANDVLVGVVSWGGKCGARAGVCTRLTYVMDVIDDVLKGATGTDSILSENLSKTELLSKINRPRRPTSNDTPASDAVSLNPGLESTSSSTGSAAISGWQSSRKQL